MKVERSQVTKFLITKDSGLDPITVFVEDIPSSTEGEPGQLGCRTENSAGKIIIECYSESWSAYFGSMGGRNLIEFFCSCDDDYLVGKLKPMASTIPDEDGIEDVLKKEILKQRYEGDLDKCDARALFKASDSVVYGFHESLMDEVFGADWRSSMPEVPNPHYTYLCRIVSTVRDAFKMEADWNREVVIAGSEDE